MHTYEDRGIYVTFLMEEKTLSMKQAVTNITECGCAESPAPSISCRTLQHKCFVHVEKNDVFPLHFYDKQI